MISDLMYYLLWVLSHAFLTVIELTRDVFLLVYYKLKRAYVGCIRRYFNVQVNVFDDSVKFKKIPQHLTVLLPMTNHNLSDLANLVIWAMATRISYISFHDPLGLLHKREEEFVKKIQERVADGQKVIWQGGEIMNKNGYSGTKIHMKLLTPGRTLLVDSCKHLLNEEVLTVATVNEHQLSIYEFPDPQLGIHFGKYFNLHGYPAWQMRLTEFFKVKRLDHITEEDFVHLLERYNMCEHRVGT